MLIFDVEINETVEIIMTHLELCAVQVYFIG